jgi:ADP-ribosylglycohydrolase
MTAVYPATYLYKNQGSAELAVRRAAAGYLGGESDVCAAVAAIAAI